MNRWNIPDWLEKEVRKRDRNCVYCGIEFDNSIKKTTASWEHIINDAKIITLENICLCCISCNASKGAKELHNWINNSKYCKNKNITEETVAPVVQKVI